MGFYEHRTVSLSGELILGGSRWHVGLTSRLKTLSLQLKGQNSLQEIENKGKKTSKAVHGGVLAS